MYFWSTVYLSGYGTIAIAFKKKPKTKKDPNMQKMSCI